MELIFLSLYAGSFVSKDKNEKVSVFYLIGVPTNSCRPNVYKVYSKYYENIAKLGLKAGDKVTVFFDGDQRVSMVNRA